MPLIVTAHPSIAVSNGFYFHNTSRKLELQDLLEFFKGASDREKKPNPCVLTSCKMLVRTSWTTVTKRAFELSMSRYGPTNYNGYYKSHLFVSICIIGVHIQLRI